jgi:hypothetical protein
MGQQSTTLLLSPTTPTRNTPRVPIRWFNPADEELLHDLLRARAPAEEMEDVSDEVEELRYERWEDVEGWETEEEWD